MLDFRQITLICFGYCLLKHKMTICSKNLEGHDALGPLTTPMVNTVSISIKLPVDIV